MFSETKTSVLGKRPRGDWLLEMIKENKDQISELEKEKADLEAKLKEVTNQLDKATKVRATLIQQL